MLELSQSARRSLGTRLVIAGELDLIVEVSGLDILVATPRGSFGVTYKKSPEAPELVLKSEWVRNVKESAYRLAGYRARAWRLANDTAIELGWF